MAKNATFNAKELMSFENIIGQNRPKEILSKSIEQNRIANGYLFVGAEGVGKEAMAIEFTKALFCSSMFEKPCNTCSGCKRVHSFNHPDNVYIVPKPKTASVEDLRKIYDSLTQGPYLRRKLWASPTIGIDQIRALRKTCSIKPTENRRVIVIAEADKMTTEAANSLLKLLEEPPDSTFLILTTSRPSSMLPTILSRCQVIKFGLLTDTKIEAALLEKQSVDEETARLISRISQGSYRRALEWITQDLQERRQLAVELIRASLRDNLVKFRLLEETLQKYDKQTVRDLLNLMLIWFRDALILSNNDSEKIEKNIVNIDQFETLKKFATAFKQINYHNAFSEIENAIEMIDRNVQLNLILFVLFNKLQRILSLKG
jgi:DNA polymerase III subunit delta'